MKKLIWVFLPILFSMFLFSIGVYYSWVSGAHDGVEEYELASSIFGYSSYLFFILGLIFLVSNVIKKK